MSSKRAVDVLLSDIDDKGNVRTDIDQRTIGELAQSMEAVGQQMPARGRMVGGKCVLIDGMRRYLAARKLGWATLEVIIDGEELTEPEVLQRQLVINCQRVDLPVLDKARAIEELMQKTGWNASELAIRLGMSNATVTRLLTLLTLPEDIRQQVRTGKLAPSTAYELTKIEDPARKAELVQAATQGKLTRDATVARTARSKIAPSRLKRGPSSRAVAALSGERSVTVTARELTLDSFITTVEELLVKARRSRSRNVELGTFLRLLRDEAKAAEVNHAS